MGQQDAAHFRVLVLTLVDDRLLRDGVNQPHEDVLLLSCACEREALELAKFMALDMLEIDSERPN